MTDEPRSIIAWEDPPVPLPKRKLDVVYAELQTRPGIWAKIYSGPWILVPWYSAYEEWPDVELQTVPQANGGLFPPRDVYARYTGVSNV